MRVTVIFLASVMALMTSEAMAQQRYILRPGPYMMPRPLPRPMIVPRYQFGYPRPAPYRYVIPGQTAGYTCYMIRNGICYHY
jgi:hypothetical protein